MLDRRANGLRYPLVGGTRPRLFDGTNFKPRKLLENARAPTSRVHALLGALTERQTHNLKRETTAKLTKLFHTRYSLARTKTHLPEPSILSKPISTFYYLGHEIASRTKKIQRC